MAEWHYPEGGGIQLIHDGARAGSRYLTFVVGNLNDRLDALEAEGIGPRVASGQDRPSAELEAVLRN
ncbi:MAG: hypothetical protein ACR2N0_11880 [Rubrobacteraceae bacterium]